MPIDANQLSRQLLGRSLNAGEYRMLNEMLFAVPDELRESPVFLSERILEAKHQSELNRLVHRVEDAIQRASFESVQKLDTDLPARVDRAAISALNKVRDYMPMSGPDALRKAIKISLISFLIVAGFSAYFGFLLGHKATMAYYSPGNAFMDEDLAQCVDAATGAFVMSARNGEREVFDPADAVRDDLTKCGAQYADRRAML